MISGLLDRRITIQSKSETIATNGQRTLTWATFLTVWSNPVQGAEGSGVDEKVNDSNRVTQRAVRFRVRYNSTITNEMRIIWNGDYYRIEDTKEIGRQEGLIIMTTKLAQT